MKSDKQQSSAAAGDPLLEEYGGLALDLCLSCLADPITAKKTFRLALKDLLRTRASARFQTYLRPWVLSTVYRHIRASEQHRPKQSGDLHILE